ncbi:MAG: YibE/F family protein, partial [Desulfohalobiaceae bacterium]
MRHSFWQRPWFREAVLVGLVLVIIVGLAVWPTGFESRVDQNAVRSRGLVLGVDNAEVTSTGLIRRGDQQVRLELLDGPFAGQVVEGVNPLLGLMHRDKLFAPGETALVVLSLNQQGEVVYVNPQEHYRIGLEVLLLSLLVLALLAFGGWTGVKALLSFVFAAMILWRVLVPALLKGMDPILVSLGVVSSLTAVIIFLVAGLNRKGVVAFTGAMLGVLTSCGLALVFTNSFKINGAVLPFAETLLYSGFSHLDL